MFPLIYEINTRVWLRRLSETHGRTITLGTVPESEFTFFKSCGFDFIWLMGVWKPSLYSEAIARSHRGLRSVFLEQLDDLCPEDIAASPYAIAEYRLNPSLGEEEELEAFRSRLSASGIRLMLDFVPNHMALDNVWLAENPECFVHVSAEEQSADPDCCFEYRHHQYLAHGRDPYFPAWTDTLQLNYANPATHRMMRDVLLSIAPRCDALRCDVAMLVLKSVFDTTWGPLSGPMPGEFWPQAIEAVKTRHPDFVFLAESYWNKEWELQQLGFDYTYDKTFYDHITAHPVATAKLREHLKAEWAYHSRLCRFLENHDEERAAKKLGPNHAAAALVLLTTPGITLVHQGQMEGLKTRLPVQLLRQASEPFSSHLPDLYMDMFRLVDRELFEKGAIETLDLDTPEPSGCLAYLRRHGDEAAFVVCNFSSTGFEIRLEHELLGKEGARWTVFSTLQKNRAGELPASPRGCAIRLSAHEGIIVMNDNAGKD